MGLTITLIIPDDQVDVFAALLVGKLLDAAPGLATWSDALDVETEVAAAVHETLADSGLSPEPTPDPFDLAEPAPNPTPVLLGGIVPTAALKHFRDPRTGREVE